MVSLNSYSPSFFLSGGKDFQDKVTNNLSRLVLLEKFNPYHKLKHSGKSILHHSKELHLDLWGSCMPDEILLYIFHLILKLEDSNEVVVMTCVNLALVCKSWSYIARDDSLWMELGQRLLGDSSNILSKVEDNTDHRSVFMILSEESAHAGYVSANTYPLKIVVIGKTGAGKSNLIKEYVYKKEKEAWTPKIWDRQEVQVQVKKTNGEAMYLELSIWDTVSNRLRPLHYVGADVVIVAFSLTTTNIQLLDVHYLVDEAVHYAAGVPIVLVGTKYDDSFGGRHSINPDFEEYVLRDEDLEQVVATKAGVHGWIATSSITGYNVQKAFELAIKVALQHSPRFSRQKDDNCRVT